MIFGDPTCLTTFTRAHVTYRCYRLPLPHRHTPRLPLTTHPFLPHRLHPLRYTYYISLPVPFTIHYIGRVVYTFSPVTLFSPLRVHAFLRSRLISPPHLHTTVPEFAIYTHTHVATTADLLTHTATDLHTPHHTWVRYGYRSFVASIWIPLHVYTRLVVHHVPTHTFYTAAVAIRLHILVRCSVTTCPHHTPLPHYHYGAFVRSYFFTIFCGFVRCTCSFHTDDCHVRVPHSPHTATHRTTRLRFVPHLFLAADWVPAVAVRSTTSPPTYTPHLPRPVARCPAILPRPRPPHLPTCSRFLGVTRWVDHSVILTFTRVVIHLVFTFDGAPR